ncbi:hypothetical protein EVA_13768, partial [gut metagenome]
TGIEMDSVNETGERADKNVLGGSPPQASR